MLLFIRTISLFVFMALAIIACEVKPEVNLSPSLTPLQSSTPQLRVIATQWTAELIGELNIEGQCHRIKSVHNNIIYSLTWIPEYNVITEESIIRVTDRAGKTVILRDGETVHLGGGELASFEHLDEQSRQELLTDCPGPYWIAGMANN